MAHSEESKHKMSVAKIGIGRSPEVRQKISDSKTGVRQTETHRANIACSLRGKAKSEESNRKRSEAAKAYWAAKRAKKDI